MTVRYYQRRFSSVGVVSEGRYAPTTIAEWLNDLEKEWDTISVEYIVGENFILVIARGYTNDEKESE